MATVPIAAGMTLCDYVIFEEKSRKPTLVGCFTTLRIRQFPRRLQPFSLFATLSDGLGDVTIDLVATHLETGEEVFSFHRKARFDDPLADRHWHLRVNNFDVPEPGSFQFMLTGNGEWIAQRRLRILGEGD